MSTPLPDPPPAHPYLTVGCALVHLGGALDLTAGRPDRFWLGSPRRLAGTVEELWYALWVAKSRTEFLAAEHADRVRRLLGPIEAAAVAMDAIRREGPDAIGAGERAAAHLDRMGPYRGNVHRLGWDLLTASQDRCEVPPVPLAGTPDETARWKHVWELAGDLWNRITPRPSGDDSAAHPPFGTDLAEPPATPAVTFEEAWIDEHFRSNDQQEVLRRLRGHTRVKVADLKRLVWNGAASQDDRAEAWKKLRKRINDRLEAISQQVGTYFKVECSGGLAWLSATRRT